MIKIDLITGFLGSGKTTFIRLYAQYLISQGQRIAILENDYGAINVDMMLLKSLEGPNCDLEMVVGGNDYDCHKRRFKSKLIALGMLGYDRIIIEPSGIYDVDEFFDVLHEEPLDRWYEIGSIISIVDADLKTPLSEETSYLLVSQTADAGVIVLSKSQLATDEAIAGTLQQLNEAMEQFRCSRRFSLTRDVIAKSWDDYTDEDFAAILQSGVCLTDHIKLPVIQENGYESLFYMNVTYPATDLKAHIESLMHNPDAGHIFRIKGFLKTPDETWIELNATKESLRLTPVSQGQEVIIVIGEKLNKDVIASYWDFEFGTGKQLKEP